MKANSATAAVAVRPETHCVDAAPLLVRQRISALPVVDASALLVGLALISDGDRQTIRLVEIPARSVPVVPAVRIATGSG